MWVKANSISDSAILWMKFMNDQNAHDVVDLLCPFDLSGIE